MALDRNTLELLNDAVVKGQVAFAGYLCERILKDEPDHWPTLIHYADYMTGMSRYVEAADVLDRAESLVPETHRRLLLAQRGHCLKRMGGFAAAEKKYLLAHERDPDNATYLIYAGSAAFRGGNLARAEELARRAIACSEGCLDEAYFNLGGYLLAQLRYEEARDCFRRALEIDPDDSLVRERLEDVERVISDRSGTPEA